MSRRLISEATVEVTLMIAAAPIVILGIWVMVMLGLWPMKGSVPHSR